MNKEIIFEIPTPRTNMARHWFRSILLFFLMIYFLKGLISILEISKGRSFQKLQTKLYHVRRRFFADDTVEEQLKRLDDIFANSVKEFHSVYRNIYKPKFSNYAPNPITDDKFNEILLQPQCRSKPYLIIQVHSAPLNLKKRLAIRYSWGSPDNDLNRITQQSHSRLTYQTIFVIGRSNLNHVNKVLVDEGNHYGDILLTNFTDNYRKLSEKTMYAFRWSAKSCLPAFMLKTDDDCFVNVKNVLNFLSKQNTGRLYTGRVQWFMPANRDVTSKFYIPEDVFGDFLLPPYVSGGGYIFSGELIPKLLNASKHIKIIPNEDANTGLLMHSLKITPIENNRVLPYIYCNESIWIRPTCDFLEPYVIHGVQNYAQLWMHYNVKVLNRVHGICEQSLKYRRQLDPPLYCPTDNTV